MSLEQFATKYTRNQLGMKVFEVLQHVAGYGGYFGLFRDLDNY